MSRINSLHATSKIDSRKFLYTTLTTLHHSIGTEMSSSSSATPARKHVLFSTFPGYGHIIPLLEFAKRVGQFHDVTFAVSNFTLTDMKKRELITDADTVKMYGIQDGITQEPDHDPSNKAAMGDFFKTIYSSFGQLMATIPTAQSPEKSAIFKPVDIVIVDSFFGVLVPVGIPYYLFNAANGIIWRIILALSDDSPVVEAKDAPFMQLPEPGKPLPGVQAFEKELFLPVKRTVHLATGVITDSLREIEAESIAELEKNPEMEGLTHHFVGPLFPEEKETSSAHQATEAKVKAWLDGKAENSVVYVSFGSFLTPSDEQLTVVGEALLALGQPVIWSLREKQQQVLPEELKQQIPGQFEAAHSKILVIPWAPQKLILSHEAVGVFVSHGGWNSTLEGLSGGKPFVNYPLFADQLLNGQWVEKLGAGVLIPGARKEGGRIVPAVEFIEAIREVGGWSVTGGEFSKYRKTAEMWKNKLRDAWTPSGNSYKEFMELVQFK